MAQKIVDPLGNLIEVEETKKPGDNIRTGIVNNVFRDPAGNIIKVDKPVDVGFNFNSTVRNPKKDQRGFFEKYVTDPVTAGLAGVGEVVLK